MLFLAYKYYNYDTYIRTTHMGNHLIWRVGRDLQRKLLGTRRNSRVKRENDFKINFFAPVPPIGTAGELFHS